MSSFDPYHKWLGIPPREQPANHYRLLGLALFESDLDVIDVATEQRVTYLRQCATGQHVAESQRLLNEVAAARLCLLNADKRRVYDERLRESLAEKPSAESASRAASTSDRTAQKVAPEPREELTDVLNAAASETKPITTGANRIRWASLVRIKLTARTKMVAVAISVLVAVVVGFKLFSGGDDSSGDGTTVSAAKSLTGQRAGAEWNANGLKMPFRFCPAGAFPMGSPKNSAIHYDDEALVNVTLSQGFWIGRYEVTQAEWREVMGSTPWQGNELAIEGDRYPAVFVDWQDANLFCRTLTEQERRAGRLPKDWEYRLPTEAQWEYACRAGSETAYSFGDDSNQLVEHAWYMTNSPNMKPVHEVGGKRANAWGLHDMSGNVSEWCRDGYLSKLIGGTDPEMELPSSDRVRRGGSVLSQTTACRSAFRGRDVSIRRSFDLGFRVVIVNVSEKAVATKTETSVTKMAAKETPPVPTASTTRRLFQHNAGYWIKGEGKDWFGKSDSFGELWLETGRTADYIELRYIEVKRAPLKISVRLFQNYSLAKDGNNNFWRMD